VSCGRICARYTQGTAKYSQHHTSWLSTFWGVLKIAFHKFWQLGAVQKGEVFPFRRVLPCYARTPDPKGCRHPALNDPLWIVNSIHTIHIRMCQHFRTVNTHIVNFIERIVRVNWVGETIELPGGGNLYVPRSVFILCTAKVRSANCAGVKRRTSFEQRLLISFICSRAHRGRIYTSDI